MDTADEWFYAELLKRLKEKERQKEESYYRPLELELPLVLPQPVGDEKTREEQKKEPGERGIAVIDLLSLS